MKTTTYKTSAKQARESLERINKPLEDIAAGAAEYNAREALAYKHCQDLLEVERQLRGTLETMRRAK